MPFYSYWQTLKRKDFWETLLDNGRDRYKWFHVFHGYLMAISFESLGVSLQILKCLWHLINWKILWNVKPNIMPNQIKCTLWKNLWKWQKQSFGGVKQNLKTFAEFLGKYFYPYGRIFSVIWISLNKSETSNNVLQFFEIILPFTAQSISEYGFFSEILSLYNKIRVKENPFFSIFYAVFPKFTDQKIAEN